MDYIYCATFEEDPDGGVIVTFPDVPEALTHGADREEAAANAGEALGMALLAYVELARPLPKPSAPGIEIPVPPADALKIALIQAFGVSGLSKSEVARRLGKSENEARRLLDPRHPSKLPAMQAALAVLGKSVVVSVRDAA